MKIRTQLVVTMSLCSTLLLIAAAAVLVTNRQVEHLNAQAEIVHRIERDAGSLGYLTNDYLLFRESQQRARWETKFSSFSDNLSKLNPDGVEQQSIVDNIEKSRQRLLAVFEDAAAALARRPPHPDSAGIPAAIQVAWSRMAVQNQGVVFDAQRLEQLVRSQIDRVKQQRNIFNSVLLSIFAVYFLANYLLVFRRTLKSISDLQAGTEVIGSGNLDFVIPAERNDEIGELSRAFNRMTVNLKQVTASKSELEQEIAERRKVEEELNRQREWLQVTLSSIGDAVIAADTAGRVTFINPIAAGLTGWAPDEALGQPVQSIVRTINEDTGEPGQDIVQCVLTEGCIVQMANHTALITRKGDQVPIEDSAAPIKDGAGNLIGAVLVFRDVTAKRRAQASLREAADRFRIVADFTYNWEYWRSPDNHFLYVSPSCERITGYTREEFLKDPGLLTRLIHMDDRERVSTHMREDLFHCDACELEFRILRRDGQERWISHTCQSVINTEGRRMGRRSSNHDITERKHAEEALWKAHRRSLWLAQFPEQNPNPVVRVSGDGTVLYCNPVSARFGGWTCKVGQLLRTELLQLIGRAIAEGKNVQQVIELGGRFWLVMAAPFTEENYVTIYSSDITDRILAEAALQQREQQYRELVQNANSAIIRWKTDGTITFFNEYAQKFFGYSEAEVVGRHVDIILPAAESTEADLQHLAKEILDNPERYLHNINENICRDGRRVWMNWTNKPIRDENGNVAEILAIGSDFTQIKEAQEALAQSEYRYRTLFETMNEGFALHEILCDSEGRPCDYRFLEVNPAFESQTGLKAEKLIGRTLLDVLPGSESYWIERYGQVALTGKSDHFELWSSPLQRCYEVSAFQTEPGRFATIFLDITERKRAESALRDGEARFKLLSETASRLLATSDPQETVEDLCREVMAHLDCQTFFNFLVDEGAGRLHLNACAGIPEEEIRKIEWLDYGAAVCGCAARDGERIIAENIGSAGDPRTKLVESFGIRAYACHPLIAHDRVVGTLSFGTRTRSRFLPEEIALMKTVADQVATAMDRRRILFELRKSRDELEMRVKERTVELEKRARQLALLASELTLVEDRERRRLAGILHDNLQQMLVAAKMNVEMLSERVGSGQKPAVENILNLITQTIRVSRSLTEELYPPLLKNYGLAASLKWLGRWMQDVHGLTVDLSVDPLLDPKQADYTVLLFQSVRELLFNVVKHAGVKSARVEMRQDKEGRHRIVVSDQGPGLDPQTIWKNADAGAGFGLFSIRERMMLLGGRLEVESEPGMGASFSLVLPLEKTESAEAKPSEIKKIPAKSDRNEPSPQNIGDKIRVMLVDDHEVVRNGLAILLKNNPDIEIVGESSDGEEAVRLAREIHPDAILMDIDMPKMNGLEATRRIHAEFPHIHIIILTMYEGHEETSAALAAGASAFLNKSGSGDRLLAAIRAAAE